MGHLRAPRLPRSTHRHSLPAASYRCYSADGELGAWRRGAREKHGRLRCLLGNVVLVLLSPARSLRRFRPWEILLPQTPRRSRASPPCILGMVVLVDLTENGAGREQDAERTTSRRRGPGRGIYAASSGEDGCSGSMKRTPTAEEREREAKVCRPLRGLGSFVYLQLGAGSRRVSLHGQRTHSLKPRDDRALSVREPETLGDTHSCWSGCGPSRVGSAHR